MDHDGSRWIMMDHDVGWMMLERWMDDNVGCWMDDAGWMILEG